MALDKNDQYQEFSAFYDIYVGTWLDDLSIYLEYARRSQSPMLEIGAGSGRLTIPFAQAGVSIVAVDISPSMLTILESRLSSETAEVKRRINVIEADARQLNLGVHYDLIIVPFYTFNYFLTPQDQNAVLRSFSRHLCHHGYLLIDVFIPLNRINHCPSDPVLKVDSVDPKTGNKVRGWTAYTIDKEHQFEYRQHIFKIVQPNGTTVRKKFRTQRRYSFPAQLEHIFSDSGLHVESVFSGYKKDKPTPKSEQLLYVLRNKKEQTVDSC